MVDVLYDYQMADVLAQQSHPEDPRQLLNYRQAVFYKHHISEEEFNHSLAHYSRHPQQMKAVYEGLAHHYNVQANTTSLASGGSTSTDTILVWGQKQYTLSGNLQNRFTLEQPFPRTKKPLESLRLSFLSSSFYHQGTPQLAAALSVIYDNDSVGTTAVTLPLYRSKCSSIHFPPLESHAVSASPSIKWPVGMRRPKWSVCTICASKAFLGKRPLLLSYDTFHCCSTPLLPRWTL